MARKKETNKEYSARMERERQARVVAAAKPYPANYSNLGSVIRSQNGVYHDQTGRKHTKLVKFNAMVLGGFIEWKRWVPCSIAVDIIERPGGDTRRSPVTACSNVKIPCVIMSRKICVHWMHGKPLWFKCTPGYGTLTETEYVSSMMLKNITYGQTVVSKPKDAPFFVLKHGAKTSDARISMLKFCMWHDDYKEFRLHVRELAWGIINGGKVDLTVLRLARDFMDFARNDRVSALLKLDGEAMKKSITEAEKRRR